MRPILLDRAQIWHGFFPAVDLLDTSFSEVTREPFLSFFAQSFVGTPDGYTLEIAVPGMGRRDLQLEVSGRTLTVKGHKEKKRLAGWGRTASWFASTQFIRTMTLPADADPSGIRATCENGLLHITLPKASSARRYRVIPVEAAGETNRSGWKEKLLQPFRELKQTVSLWFRKLGFGL